MLDKDGEAHPTDSMEEWLRGCIANGGSISGRVAETQVGRCRVSTIFLSVATSYHGPPKWWETMVFGGSLDHYQRRCGGPRANAVAMHRAIVSVAADAEGPLLVWWYAQSARLTTFLDDQLYDLR